MGRKDYELSISDSSTLSDKPWYRRSCTPMCTLLIAALAAIIVGTVVGVAVAFGRSCDQSDTTSPPTAAPPTTEPPGTPGLDEVLLPTTLRPLGYDLTLRPLFYTTPDQFSFNGSVRITLDILFSTTFITLHVKSPLQVLEESIYVSSQGNTYDVHNVTYDVRLEFMTIHVTSPLVGGNKLEVGMRFSGALDNNLAGLYYSQYTDDSGATRYLVASHLHPTEARRVFPCFDEPALKSTFTVTLERRQNLNSLSNTDISQTIDIGDGWMADVYHPTPLMSTYLLAFVVSDFTCRVNYTEESKEVWVCARPNAYDQTEYAGSIAADIQDYLQRYYNVPYPLNRTVHVAVPDFPAGAMENWGCILYRETSLLYDPVLSSTSNKQRVASVVAHELAHMWFGDLVTPGWWDDIWLNEGFASYMEYIGVNAVEPDWNMAAQFLPSDLHPVMQTDSLLSSHPIYQSVSHPDQINELFDSISYSKGASVIRMMAQFLGEEIFQAGISRYLSDKAYDVTHHIDLFTTLTQVANEMGNSVNVTEVMLTWILQMGYPVVNITYSPTSGMVEVTQAHFLMYRDENSTAPPSEYNYLWQVPLTLSSSEASTVDNITVHWLKTPSGSFMTEPGADWLIGNVNQDHYYRVTYENSMWTKLSQELEANHSVISEPDRAQLIDDSFSLARPGLIDQVTALDLSLYLTNEMTYVPWTAASRSFNYLHRMLKSTTTLPYLQSYIVKQIDRVYQDVGWTPMPDDTHLHKLLRSLAVDMACSYGKKACLDEATTLYARMIAGENLLDNNTLTVDLMGSVYCYGIAAGQKAEWDYAYSVYNVSNTAAEKSMLLQALSCTPHSFILAEYLNRALSEDGIRRQDFTAVVTNVARNRNGEQLSWDLVRLNWDIIYVRFGTTSLYALSNLITGVTESFSTIQRLNELKEFQERESDRLGSAERALSQALENTVANIAWRGRSEAAVRDWLVSH